MQYLSWKMFPVNSFIWEGIKVLKPHLASEALTEATLMVPSTHN